MKYGIIGLGFIYNKHKEAISNTGGEIIVGCDTDATKADKLPSEAIFTPNWKDLDDYKLDVVVILTPNHLHLEMADFFSKKGKLVLVEKPPTHNLEDFKKLKELPNVFTVLQLRHHPKLQEWIKKVKENDYSVADMRILVRRDDWYFDSWKGKEKESGGICLNIGVHYFDVLVQLFGKVMDVRTEQYGDRYAKGVIIFGHTLAQWELSLEAPMDNQKRILMIDGNKLNLSQGFENLHTKVYEELLVGRGIPIRECEQTIQLIDNIKNV
tara:strand:+ start:42 stop:845 length:804 start_codon:yes stop_codon:yes gene_type:complete